MSGNFISDSGLDLKCMRVNLISPPIRARKIDQFHLRIRDRLIGIQEHANKCNKSFELLNVCLSLIKLTDAD